ncbi:HNH endonuclease [Mycobacterium phage Edugator]|uniref:HNH endonuclease n=1 Tax=Mycobacterium phage Edugator TaxID=2015843 RepID=A0A222ZMQ6_9CAUD|nr:HNH endonuclease [Mycobacterium phage Edugator]
MSDRATLELHDSIRFGRADGRCECTGKCGYSHKFGAIKRCTNTHGRPAVHGTDKMVSLTVQPIDGDDRNQSESNLIALCQSCAKRHRARVKAAAERAAEKAAARESAGGLFDLELDTSTGAGSHTL